MYSALAFLLLGSWSFTFLAWTLFFIHICMPKNIKKCPKRSNTFVSYSVKFKLSTISCYLMCSIINQTIPKSINIKTLCWALAPLLAPPRHWLKLKKVAHVAAVVLKQKIMARWNSSKISQNLILKQATAATVEYPMEQCWSF